MNALYAFIVIAVFVSWVSFWLHTAFMQDSTVVATLCFIMLVSPLALLAL